MKKYIRLPDGSADDIKRTTSWAERALDNVASFPPK